MPQNMNALRKTGLRAVLLPPPIPRGLPSLSPILLLSLPSPSPAGLAGLRDPAANAAARSHCVPPKLPRAMIPAVRHAGSGCTGARPLIMLQ